MHTSEVILSIHPTYAGSMPFPLVNMIVAVLAAVILLRVGMKILGGFARPVPEPPDPGELRKVRLTYQCSICSTTVRMTMANDEVPEPPRHCQEDMDLITSPDDI
jgi:hypothetical protein